MRDVWPFLLYPTSRQHLLSKEMRDMANLNLTLEQRFSMALTIADRSDAVIVNVPDRGFYRLQRITDAEMLAFVLRHQTGDGAAPLPKR